MSPAAAVRAAGLGRRFGAVRALHGIDLNISRGESVAIVGPNGAGKTTLLRVLALGLRPTSGTLEIDGLDPRKQEQRIRGSIGVVSHRSYLYGGLSANENLRFFGGLHGVQDPGRRGLQLLEEVDLIDRADDTVETFSRGMRQRVSLARALVHDPPILLLDEPFTGLDPRAAERFHGMLQRLRQAGRTLLVVSHDLPRALELSDRWILLLGGRLLDSGLSPETDPGALARTWRATDEAQGS